MINIEPKILSLRKRKIKYGSLALILMIFIYLALNIINKILIEQLEIKSNIIGLSLKVLIITFIVYVSLLMLTILFKNGFSEHKNVFKSFKMFSLKNDIDKTFINTGIYNVVRNISDNEKLAETPKIKVISSDLIHIQNLSGTTEKLKKFKVHLSSLLKDGYVCETLELNITQEYFIAKLINLNNDNQKIINNHLEFIDFIKDTKQYQIKIMDNFIKDISRQPHLLIAGETGSGKSYLLYFIMFQMILKDCELYVIDRKKVLTKFKTIIGVNNVAYDKEDIFELIETVNKEMDLREKYLNDNYPEDLDIDFTRVEYKPIFLIIDELGSFISELDTKEKKRFNGLLQSIIQRGRATGVNIIIAMQQPNAQDLPTAIRDQFTFKTVLGNTDDTTRHLVFKADDLMDLNFKKGQGYFINSETHNKVSILFVPTFKFPLDIPNFNEIQELYNNQCKK